LVLPIAALALVLAMGPVESRTSAVDADATARALRIRVGERADAWTIELDDGAARGEVHARMRRAARSELSQSFALHGATVEERSRELAAAIALVIEQHATDTSQGTATAPHAAGKEDAAAPPEGWIALGGRLSAGHPADPEGGVTVRGGATWGRRIVQPLALLGTMHARRDELHVDGVRMGLGVAIGRAIPRTPLWLGGTAVPEVAWTHARGRGRASGWSSVTEVGVLAQVRTRVLLVGVRLGIELAAPPLHASDRGTDLRFGVLRFGFGLEIGMLLHARRR
jgi:hypothetical protein